MREECLGISMQNSGLSGLLSLARVDGGQVRLPFPAQLFPFLVGLLGGLDKLADLVVVGGGLELLGFGGVGQ